MKGYHCNAVVLSSDLLVGQDLSVWNLYIPSVPAPACMLVRCLINVRVVFVCVSVLAQ